MSPARVGEGFDHRQQVVPLFVILVMMSLQKCLSNLHSYTVIQFMSCLLMVKHQIYTQQIIQTRTQMYIRQCIYRTILNNLKWQCLVLQDYTVWWLWSTYLGLKMLYSSMLNIAVLSLHIHSHILLFSETSHNSSWSWCSIVNLHNSLLSSTPTFTA